MSPFQLPSARRAGFSLIEMIGVLAIIAILAAVIVPRVFSTIASSRITSAVGGVNTMKSAVTDFASRYGTIPFSSGTSRIDDLLVTTGILESRFNVKIGNQAVAPAGGVWTRNASGVFAAAGGSAQANFSRVISLAAAPGANPGVGTNYRLDGTTNIPAGSKVISAVITQATASEAFELSQRIDGPQYSQPDATTADAAGKVVYAAPAANGLTTVYIYLAHQ
jgi:prepilin-type N-terminal cleavage/methylation domain-containing protein